MSELAALCQAMSSCQECGLAKQRKQVVPGEGAEHAQIMFIGEAPGYYEDQQGRPFVGPAGQFLNELLASVGLKREEVYIGNVVKCRPPNNRDPLPTEIAACKHWLDSQIALIRPRIVVTLGRYSLARYFPGQSISKVHGTWYRRDGVVYYAMYHPAAALHQQTLRRVIEEDMRKLPELLAQAEERLEAPKDPTPQQLALF